MKAVSIYKVGKQCIFAAAYTAIFLLVDRASLEALTWEGAPPWYLPNGLTLALVICGGIRYAPLVLVSNLAGAFVNYHRELWSWSGLPGVIAINLPYIAAAIAIRRRPSVVELGSLKAVARFLGILLTAGLLDSILGALTLLGDGYVARSGAFRAALNWWISDAVAITS